MKLFLSIFGVLKKQILDRIQYTRDLLGGNESREEMRRPFRLACGLVPEKGVERKHRLGRGPGCAAQFQHPLTRLMGSPGATLACRTMPCIPSLAEEDCHGKDSLKQSPCWA